MKLVKLSLENVRSYTYQEIKFPLGSTILAGDVGSGKTTILMALEFAFFGLQPGQRGISLVANGKDEASIKLDFEIEGNEVCVERKLKRTSKGVNQEYSAITVNGSKEEMSVSELKLRILSLLGYPEEFLKRTNTLYRYTVYSPQEEMKQIIIDDAESRLDSLRHIFGIDKYKRIKENLQKVALHIREMTKVHQGEIKDIEPLRNKITDQTNLIKKVEDSVKIIEKELNSKKEFRRAIEKELSAINENLAEKQTLDTEIEKTNIALKGKLQYLADYQSQLKLLEDSTNKEFIPFNEKHYEEVTAALSNNNKKLELLSAAIIDYKSSINSLIAKKKQDSEKLNRVSGIDICTTCFQKVSQAHKHTLSLEVEINVSQTEKELTGLHIAQQAAEKELSSVRREIELLQQSKIDLGLLKSKESQRRLEEEVLKELRKKIDAIKKDIVTLEEHLVNRKKDIFRFSKYDLLSKVKQEELKKALNEEKSEEIKIAELKREKEIRLVESELIRKEISRKESVKEKMLKLIELETWLSETFMGLINFLERNILLKLRQEFSRYFNAWFKSLTNENFFAHLDENFTPVVLQGNYETDYEFLSGGERTAVALAYRLALNQIISRVHSTIKTKDLLILDEPTDGFSEQQLYKIREIIPELDVKQLIIVSHEPKIESFVDNIIKIKKQGGISAVI